MSDKQREAMRQALEALEAAHNGLEWYRDRHPESVDGCDDEADKHIEAACSALRAVLAEPERQPMTASDLWNNSHVMALNANLGLTMEQIIALVRATERHHGIAAADQPVERCPCGYPMPCVKRVSVGLCRAAADQKKNGNAE